MMDNGMMGVTVKKDELLTALRGNREAHRKLFLEAQEGYREAVIIELDKMLKDAREGRHITRSISLVEPHDHTKEYNCAIRMLEMCVHDTVFISDAEFMQFVQDDWGWKNQFVAQTANYTKQR